MLAALALALTLLPVHGTVLGTAPGGDAIVRNDPVTQTVPSTVARYHLVPAIPVAAGTGVDGWLDRSTTPWTLRDAVAAAPFSPGIPDPGRVIPVDAGKMLPAARLIDQAGHTIELDRSYRGKTVLLSFVFTRCPDRTLCPAISGKYAYLQSHLDPAHFALVEITLDPPYDSPAVLRDYGANYGSNAASWSLLTGTGSTIQHLLNEFGIDSMRVSSANFIHNDKLFIVTPEGRVAYIIETGGWDPDGVIAEARNIAGMASNPFERFKLSLIAGVVALCGGSQFAGIVLLELALFGIIVAIVASGLWIVARVLWKKA